MLKSTHVTALADRTLRDLVPVLDRYRPAVLAATAVLVAVAVLPGATRDAGPATPAAFDGGAFDQAADDTDASVATGAPAPSTGGPAADASPPADAPGSTSSFTPPAPRPVSPSPAPSSGTGSGSSAAPAPAPSFGGSDPVDAGDDTRPLQITVTAWASTTGGTPIPSDVPEGSLPVGARVDQVDKASYIRLQGDGTTLVLTEVADGRRGSDFEASPVQACQITDADWEAGEDLSFDDAPAHDPDDCVAATQGSDGTWSIPLVGFADPTDDRGLALVPSPDAPLDFQVTFASVLAS